MYYSYSELSKTATIYLKVKAAAKMNKIENFIFIQDKFMLKMSLLAAPESGKANIAIKKILAKIWNLRQAQLELVKGHNQNIKLIAIKDIEEEKIEELIAPYVRSI